MAKKDKTTKVINRPQNEKERKLALEAAMAQIEKEMGKGSLMFLGDKSVNSDIEVIPTGALSLDVALGVGGLPRGRIVELYGKESSGKTTVALHIVAETQKMGGTAAFIDAEHALDPEYARKIGVDIDHLLISQPDSGEDGLNIAETLARSGAVDLIVVDSVAALVPKSEIEGAMGDATMGVHARLMSQALRKLASVINKSNTLIVFINQVREKIGGNYGGSYGPPETTTGGRALKFYASVRLDVRAGERISKGDEYIGHITKVKIVKNKLAPPFKLAEFEIRYGHGILAESSIIETAVEYGVLTRRGSWYSYGDQRLGQGSNAVLEWLLANPEESKKIQAKVRELVRDRNKEKPEIEAAKITKKKKQKQDEEEPEADNDIDTDLEEDIDDILDLDL